MTRLGQHGLHACWIFATWFRSHPIPADHACSGGGSLVALAKHAGRRGSGGWPTGQELTRHGQHGQTWSNEVPKTGQTPFTRSLQGMDWPRAHHLCKGITWPSRCQIRPSLGLLKALIELYTRRHWGRQMRLFHRFYACTHLRPSWATYPPSFGPNRALSRGELGVGRARSLE